MARRAGVVAAAVLAGAAILPGGPVPAVVEPGSREWLGVLEIKAEVASRRADMARALDGTSSEEARSQIRHCMAWMDEIYGICEDVLKDR